MYLLTSSGPRVYTTLKSEVSEGGKKPSLAYIMRKEGVAMIWISIAALVMQAIQLGIQVAEFLKNISGYFV